ncbi:MAG TPA: asparagine synthase (glutamine-hydrolyzing) [Candidatus Polarisedimenticolia bacterium]|nr:asparagine synthase (glutamine-hydrolyzing) [Candidatus Polarisedimenticolia bacterium]
MCGICGLVDQDGGGVTPATVEAMTGRIAHRGPDDHGTFVTPRAGLGHRRLSIIDLSAAGHQPMTSADGSMVAIYNGEIYNYRELKATLTAAGVTFRTGTDTEVAIEAFVLWGVAAFARFNGMFTFAFLNRRTGEVHLVRDRFGIKPLYYLERDGSLAFASEIKAILASGRLEARVDPAALHEYLYYGAALGERTLYAGVRKLLPGHYARFADGRLEVREYVSIHDAPPVEGPVPQLVERLRGHLDAAVRRHLIADVPVGVFLSGGVDSSAITAFASRHAGGRLSTYSVDFDFQYHASEAPNARRVAELYGTDHHELRVSGSNLPTVIEELVGCHDEPFGDAADIPLFLLARELRGSIKVVLQGDGGDEMFAGYRRYKVLAWERFWRSAAAFSRPAWPLLRGRPGRYRLRRFLQAMGEGDRARRTALLMTDETLEFPPTGVLSADLRSVVERTDPFERYRTLDARLAALDPVQRMLYTDAAILLPDIFLEKVDKSTMAHALEVRVPFLDHELAAFAMGLPADLKVRGTSGKWLLKAALRGLVPDAILDGPKRGFGVPYAQWLAGPLYGYLETTLRGRTAQSLGLFDDRLLGRILQEHRGGIRDHGFLLWKLLNLVIWIDRYRVSLAR